MSLIDELDLYRADVTVDVLPSVSYRCMISGATERIISRVAEMDLWLEEGENPRAEVYKIFLTGDLEKFGSTPQKVSDYFSRHAQRCPSCKDHYDGSKISLSLSELIRS